MAEYTDPKIRVDSQKKLNEKYTMVSSTLLATSEKPEIKIDWRVITKNLDNPLIIDVIIEGVSLAKVQREEFNSIIQNNVVINNYSIINTGAIIEHDNVIGKAVHIAPSACTAGRVTIHDLSFIGIGALVIPEITIGYGAFINAGVVVKKNVEDGLTMVGYTAKIHSKNIYHDIDK